MGLFFEDNKSIQPFRTINKVLNIAGLVLFAMFLFKDFDSFLLELLLIVFGLTAVSQGTESWLTRKKKETIFFDFGSAILYFWIAFF